MKNLNLFFMMVILTICVSACSVTRSLNFSCVEGDCNNGYGVYVWGDGSRYEGEWKDGLMHNGTYTWPDGTKYVGKFENGEKSVFGTMYFPDGSKYVG
ncbi:MAG: hypothetical protein OQK82_08120 [Candidatus Pacearchaeota archaeon]|nr:hypothetical protein [Candidatus Pacearchaeota archaeon]